MSSYLNGWTSPIDLNTLLNVEKFIKVRNSGSTPRIPVHPLRKKKKKKITWVRFGSEYHKYFRHLDLL